VATTRNYGAKVGQAIAGRLYRGKGGKFTGEGEAAAPAAEEPKREAQAAAADKPAEQAPAPAPAPAKDGEKPKKLTREEQQAANRNKVFDGMKGTLEEDQFYALMDFADGSEVEADQLQALAGTGLVELDSQGRARLTEAGRSFMAAANRGDVRDAQDAASVAQDRYKAKVERDAKAAAPKGGGGGAAPAPAEPEEEQPTADQQRAANRKGVYRQVAGGGLKAESLKGLGNIADGLEPRPADVEQLVAAGLVELDPDGKPQLTQHGETFMQAADEGKTAAARRSLAAAKRESTAEKRVIAGYFAFEKVDREQRLVAGIASTMTIDRQPGIWKGKLYEGDIIDVAAIEEALPDFMKWANLREMHGKTAAGSVLKADIVDGQLQIEAYVVDDGAWNKVRKHVYKGFSIGGRVVDAIVEKVAGKWVRRVTKMLLTEISLVDRPANPDARILLFKGVTMDDEMFMQLLKAADPDKVIAQLQVLRDEIELAGDLESAAFYTQAIALVLTAKGDAEPAAEEPAAEEPAEGEPVEGEPIAMSAQAQLQKGGKTFSRRNSTSTHKVIQSLARMLADAGDETAVKVVAAYGAEEPAAAPAQVDKGEQAGDLAKALAPQLGDITKAIGTLGERLDRIERQPTDGGPVLRQVDKTIVGQAPAEPAAPNPSNLLKGQLDQLDRLAKTATTQAARDDYRRQADDLRKSIG
jgi:hypothetical protein